MRNRWLAAVLCLVMAAGFIVSLGCTAENTATAAASIRADARRLPDDVLWVLGLDEPSILYEDTFPPYHTRQ